MTIEFHTPKNERLQELIEGYYFITDKEIGGSERYLTFPNNYCIVTTNLNSEVEISTCNISILPSGTENIYTSIVHRYVRPIRIYYEKPIREITMYFKPLGLNHFVDNPNNLFSKDRTSDVNSLLPGLNTEMLTIFNSQTRELQIQELEELWLSLLKENDFTRMQAILDDLELLHRIEYIAEKQNISRKHLNAIFSGYLGKSPGEYQKIFRFRKAISSKGGIRNLTEMAYENYFYDQSHLIKDFKALTNIKPKSFFRDVDSDQKNVWLFI